MNIFEALKEEWPELKPYMEQWGKEVAGGTEAGAILLGASMLDALLKKLLRTVIVNDAAFKKLLGTAPGAPMGSFSAKIDVAYALGLISKDHQGQLHVIREVRNDFAHSLSAALKNNNPKYSAKLMKEYNRHVNSFVGHNDIGAFGVLILTSALQIAARLRERKGKIVSEPKEVDIDFWKIGQASKAA